MAKAETQVNTVKMDDGTIVDFPGKRQMQKTSTIAADGTVSVRLDFVNGEWRLFQIPASLLLKFAAHGAEQKLGDHIAGLKGKDGGEADIDDKVFAIDELMERLNAGEWRVETAGSGLAGVSILAKALAEVNGIGMDKVKAFLKDRTQAEKMALRANPKVKPVVERLEREQAERRAAKGGAGAVDTDALLAGLTGAEAGAEG